MLPSREGEGTSFGRASIWTVVSRTRHAPLEHGEGLADRKARDERGHGVLAGDKAI